MNPGVLRSACTMVTPVFTAPKPYSRALSDRKSTRLNSSHVRISYAVFCLKKKSHAFDVPSTLVERRTQALLESLELRLPEGAERTQALARLGEQLRPRAERQVRAELLLDALAARDAIVVSDDELDAEIDGIAAREGQVVERVRAFYERPEARAALRAKLVRDRALARVLAAARVMPSSPAESVAHEK